MKIQSLTRLKKWSECGLVAVILSLSANIAMATDVSTGPVVILDQSPPPASDNGKSGGTTGTVDDDGKKSGSSDGPYFPGESK